MCTVSWLRRAGGYTLFCNRDEKRERGPELPPETLELAGARALAPRDGDAGGTWISVNEHGLALCVLNGYLARDAARTEPARSRGLLVLDLADARSTAELRGRFERVELGLYRSLVLLALEPQGGTLVLEWDGRARSAREGAEMPLVSSSYEPEVVRARRAALLRESGALEESALEAYHASHAGGPSAYSVCMHRDDAETRSSTRVEVDGKAVRLRYTPGPPCRTRPLAELVLARAAGPVAR